MIKQFEYSKIIGDVQFGDYCIIDDFSIINGNNGKIRIGSFCHICAHTTICGLNVEIGNFVAISHGCKLFAATDDYSEHGFGNSALSLITQNHKKYRNLKEGYIKIHDFAIIGANSVILPNVVIAEGVAVGAGSKVTKDLDMPYGIYINNKLVGTRDEAGIKKQYKHFLKEFPFLKEFLSHE